MTNFKQITDNTIHFEVDCSIYNDTIISKVLYWLSSGYIISRSTLSENNQQIVLERQVGIFTPVDIKELRSKLNQDFIDYKTRSIVTEETKNIRDILYIKAFANGEDFEDYNLMAN